MKRFASYITAAVVLILACIGGRAQSIQFLPDGNPWNLNVVPYNGNSIQLWCPATAQWQTFKLPPPVAITGAENNGAGAIRVTHAATARPFVTGQWVSLSGILGTTEANKVVAGAWKITVVDSTHFDLIGSTFTNAYVSGGRVDGNVVARYDDVTINGTASQVLPTFQQHLAGMRYVDAGCTVAEIVLDSVLTGPGWGYTQPNADPDMGFSVLPSYTSVPLVGLVIRDPALGIQGSGSSELTLTWFNRGFVPLRQTYGGSTGGLLNTPVSLTPAGGNKIQFLLWQDWGARITCTFILGSTVPANVTAHVKITGTQTQMWSQGVRHDGVGFQQIVVQGPIFSVESSSAFFTLDAALRTDAGTVSAGVAYNSTCVVDVHY